MKKILTLAQLKKQNKPSKQDNKYIRYIEYSNGDYAYEVSKEIYKLIRNGKVIAKGKGIMSYPNGLYEVDDNNMITHLFNKKGKRIAKGTSLKIYGNNCVYKGTDGLTYVLNNGNVVISGVNGKRYGSNKFEIIDKDNQHHLIVRGEVKCSGREITIHNYGDYSYKDNDWITHLIRNDEEIFVGNVLMLNVLPAGEIKYLDRNGLFHLVIDGNEVAVGTKFKMYPNGDFKYTNQDREVIFVKREDNSFYVELEKEVSSIQEQIVEKVNERLIKIVSKYKGFHYNYPTLERDSMWNSNLNELFNIRKIHNSLFNVSSYSRIGDIWTWSPKSTSNSTPILSTGNIPTINHEGKQVVDKSNYTFSIELHTCIRTGTKLEIYFVLNGSHIAKSKIFNDKNWDKRGKYNIVSLNTPTDHTNWLSDIDNNLDKLEKLFDRIAFLWSNKSKEFGILCTKICKEEIQKRQETILKQICFDSANNSLNKLDSYVDSIHLKKFNND